MNETEMLAFGEALAGPWMSCAPMSRYLFATTSTWRWAPARVDLPEVIRSRSERTRERGFR
jgi:hypothetical protein